MPPKQSDNDSQWMDYAVQQAVGDALEAERRRLAQRLQETLIGQINLLLAQLNVYQQAAPAQSQMAFSVLATLVRQLHQSAHDLETSLNPTALETLGLEPALEAYASQQRRSSGVNITLSLAHLVRRLPPHLELALFRTTQDAVERAITRGRASQISIHLARTENGIAYTLTDSGLPPDEDIRSDGDILRAARQRIAALGGLMTLAKGQSGGLVVSIVFEWQASAQLTDREREVIGLLAEGLTNRAIALALDVRPRTVKFHLDNIYSKLGVGTRTEAAIYALRQGWVGRRPPAQTDIS